MKYIKTLFFLALMLTSFGGHAQLLVPEEMVTYYLYDTSGGSDYDILTAKDPTKAGVLKRGQEVVMIKQKKGKRFQVRLTVDDKDPNRLVVLVESEGEWKTPGRVVKISD